MILTHAQDRLDRSHLEDGRIKSRKIQKREKEKWRTREDSNL